MDGKMEGRIYLRLQNIQDLRLDGTRKFKSFVDVQNLFKLQLIKVNSDYFDAFPVENLHVHHFI